MKIRTYQVSEKAGEGKLVELDIPSGHYVAKFRSLNMAVPADQMKAVLPLPTELMQVSGTSEGRKKLHEYIRKEWVATVSNELIAPQWYFLGYGGADENDIDDHQLTYCVYALVADKPFGVVCWENCRYYDNMGYYPGWEDFVLAGRIKGTHITRGVEIRRPKFIKGDSETLNKNGWRWTQLSELARVLGEDPLTLWEFYFHIGIGSSHCLIGCTGHSMLLGRGNQPGHPQETFEDDGSHSELVPPPLWHHEWNHQYGNFPHPFKSGGLLNEAWLERMAEIKRKVDPTKVWVPAGWAMQACYLHHFGFRPQK